MGYPKNVSQWNHKFQQFDSQSIQPFQIPTAWKVSVFRVILVHIFQAFSRIRTEYGEIRRTSISPYSVQMRENAGKMRTRITLNTDTFHAVTITTVWVKKKLPVTLLFLQKCYDNLFIYSPWKHQKIRGLEMSSGAGWGSKKQAFQTSPGGRGPSLITIEIFLRVFSRIWNWVISA